MRLNELRDNPGSRKTRVRVGRGIGSGMGKQAGRGGKGQTARSGVRLGGFEGGQMPLHRRLPKRGFSNAIFKKHFAIVNTGMLEKLAGDTFTPESLLQAGIVKKLGDGLKVLANGDLTRKISVSAHLFSKAAEEKIKAAGGTVTVIEKKAAPAEK